MTMADGCPPSRIGVPTLPVASATETSEPACCVTHAVAPSALECDALGHIGQGDGGTDDQLRGRDRHDGCPAAHVGGGPRRRHRDAGRVERQEDGATRLQRRRIDGRERVVGEVAHQHLAGGHRDRLWPRAHRDGGSRLHRRDVDRGDRVAAEVGHECRRGAGCPDRDRDGHGLGADRHRPAGPPGPEVDRGHGVRIEVRHQCNALASGPAGRHCHGVGLDAHPRAPHHVMGGGVDLVQLVVALGHHEQPGPTGRVGQRRGQAADRHRGSDVAPGQVHRCDVHAGQRHRGALGHPRHVVHRACCRRASSTPQGRAARPRGRGAAGGGTARCAQPRAQAAPAGRSAALQPPASPSGQKSPVTSSCT